MSNDKEKPSIKKTKPSKLNKKQQQQDDDEGGSGEGHQHTANRTQWIVDHISNDKATKRNMRGRTIAIERLAERLGKDSYWKELVKTDKDKSKKSTKDKSKDKRKAAKKGEKSKEKAATKEQAATGQDISDIRRDASSKISGSEASNRNTVRAIVAGEIASKVHQNPLGFIHQGPFGNPHAGGLDGNPGGKFAAKSSSSVASATSSKSTLFSNKNVNVPGQLQSQISANNKATLAKALPPNKKITNVPGKPHNTVESSGAKSTSQGKTEAPKAETSHVESPSNSPGQGAGPSSDGH